MARRSDHNREEIREMAIDAAIEIVKDKGASALSARSIAARIGYSVGALYLVFQNLDDLIAHVNGRTLDGLYQVMADAATGRSKPLTKLKRMGRAYAGFAEEHPQLWRMSFEHRLPVGQKAPAQIDLRGDSLIQLVLEPLSEASGLSGKGLETAAQVLWSGIHGICILTNSKKMHFVGSTRLEQLTDSLIDNYLAGLEARKGS